MVFLLDSLCFFRLRAVWYLWMISWTNTSASRSSKSLWIKRMPDLIRRRLVFRIYYMGCKMSWTLTTPPHLLLRRLRRQLPRLLKWLPLLLNQTTSASLLQVLYYCFWVIATRSGLETEAAWADCFVIIRYGYVQLRFLLYCAKVSHLVHLYPKKWYKITWSCLLYPDFIFFLMENDIFLIFRRHRA